MAADLLEGGLVRGTAVVAPVAEHGSWVRVNSQGAMWGEQPLLWALSSESGSDPSGALVMLVG
ncbi:MAG: hypothetical protein ACR2NV_12030 [Thermoleophilaceae bacterium]